MKVYKFILAVMSVYRLTRLIVKEEGPGDVLCRLRGEVTIRAVHSGKERGFWPTLHGLVSCEYCTSVWVAALMSVFVMKKSRFAEWVLTWLGLAGVFCLIQEHLDGRLKEEI